MEDIVHEGLVELSQTLRDLHLNRKVTVLEEPPEPLVFLREFVAANKPVLIKNAMRDWRAMGKWQDDAYLLDKMSDSEVTVAVTPDGRADAISPDGQYFVEPHYEKKALREVFEKLRKDAQEGKPSDGEVHYVQLQNNNLHTEFSLLNEDVPEDIPFATAAIGSKPETSNIWIGNDESTTSIHKDFYENIYAVIRGTKIFTIFPPCDIAFLHENMYKTAKYERNDQEATGFRIVPDEPEKEIPWIALDAEFADIKEYPEFRYAEPFRVVVGPGEMLFLPAMWYHQVGQMCHADDDKVIAVNYWYDMSYDHRFAHYQLIRKLCQLP